MASDKPPSERVAVAAPSPASLSPSLSNTLSTSVTGTEPR